MFKSKSNQINPIPSITTQAWEPHSRRRSIVREFALNTSTHALPGIARSKSLHNRLFWTVSFLAFTGIMFFFIVQSITYYFQYPTQTTIAVVMERNQIFPAVTVCNGFPARADRIAGLLFNFTNSRNLTSVNDTSTITEAAAIHLLDLLVETVNRGQNISEYLFSLDIMLMNCTFNSLACNISDFITFTSPIHGRCYTFNARRTGGTTTSLRRVTDQGGSGRLELRFYAHGHLYIPLASRGVSAGMVVLLHDNSEVPMIDVASIELAAGRKHKLSYRKKANYFLSPPYTQCTTKRPDVMEHMFKRYGGADYKYSQGVCNILCTQAYVYEKCGCVNHIQWLARSVRSTNTSEIIDAPLCGVKNPCQYSATTNISTDESLWNAYCSHCQQECTVIEYKVTPSSVSAPSFDVANTTKAFVESTGVRLPQNWSTNWLTEVQNNYVGLDIVCESILVENYTQEASVTAVDVLSNVGGHTGLWIGISFLSVMELVEMLYRLLRHEYRVVLRRITNRH